MLFGQSAFAGGLDTLCREICRPINPAKCRAYREKDPYGYMHKWYIVDYTKPAKPVQLINMCGAEYKEVKATLGWLRKHKITEQCELRGYFPLPHLFYYLSNKKAPVTYCAPSSDIFLRGSEAFNNPDRCDTLHEIELVKDRDVKIVTDTADGTTYDYLSFYHYAFTLYGDSSEIQRFFCLMEKYQWNTMGFFFRTEMSHRAYGTFFMRYEEPKE